jgi:hypothetical protein
MTVLVHCSLLGGVSFGEPGVVLMVDVLLLLGLEYHSESFIFLVSFSFFGCMHPYCH